ncbi:uncharacterized protein METZ01_LOCUS362384 [marine metagenome]|uniref:Uncharacterized protein n=1 Tax=marine metagenome TaxID=408172 RepID=A0A382SHU6_9ZZZZ
MRVDAIMIDGKFGKAVKFDRGQNYILIEHDDAFNLEAGDFSVGCWMQAENKDAYVISGLNKTEQFSLVIISLTIVILFAGVCYEH